MQQEIRNNPSKYRVESKEQGLELSLTADPLIFGPCSTTLQRLPEVPKLWAYCPPFFNLQIIPLPISQLLSTKVTGKKSSLHISSLILFYHIPFYFFRISVYEVPIPLHLSYYQAFYILFGTESSDGNCFCFIHCLILKNQITKTYAVQWTTFDYKIITVFFNPLIKTSENNIRWCN